MPFGYLATTALMAVLTLFAVAPPRPDHSSPSNVSYWLGFLINELPFIAFYWLLASTVLAAAEGDPSSPLGLLALAIAVVTSGGLAVVLRRGCRPGPRSSAPCKKPCRLHSSHVVCGRLGPSARFPDHLIDAKRVIAWACEHSSDHGAASKIVVAGSSAGANLAATVALTPNERNLQPGFEQADTSVSAAVCLYGYYGNYGGSRTAPSSPLAHVHADAPPFFVAHGDRDTIVLVEDARAFVEALRRVSTSRVVYAELPGAQHTFDLFRSPRFERVVEGIEAFVGDLI